MMRAIVLLIATCFTLGCSGSTTSSMTTKPDPCEEMRELEAIAASALGLKPPVEFVRLDISTCTEGLFVDSEGFEREFCINTGWCGEGRVGWSIGPCLHSALPSFNKPRIQVNPAEGYSIRILLGVWLARNYSPDELARLPDFRGTNPESTDLEYLAFHVFRQSADPLSCVITEALLCSETGRAQ
jgi:hypothetical protein